MSTKKTVWASAVTAALLATVGSTGTAIAAGPGTGQAAGPVGTGPATSGYHVNSYDVRLGYDPAKETLSGEATLDVVVQERRDALDFRLQLPVRSVQIDGKTATAVADKSTLRVKPTEQLTPGRRIKVHVTYAGDPRRTLDDPSEDNSAWAATKDGGRYLALDTAGVLFPANSDDSDRSAIHLQARVPDGWTAVSNGPSGTPRKDGDRKVYRWDNPEPMQAGYVHFGVGDKWTESDEKLPDGTPVHFVYGDGAEGRGRKLAEVLGEAATWQAGLFGKYRHESLTVSFLDFKDPNVPNVTGWNTISMAMEYPGDTGTQPVTQDVLVHELAHTWLEAVRANDGYVEETIPTYLQWAWQEKFRKADLVTMYRDKVKKIQWQSANVYTTSGAAMYALRRLVGDAAFDRALKDWLPSHADRPTAWEAFRISLEKHSGKDLKLFFAGWFQPEETKPSYPGDELVWPDWAKG